MRIPLLINELALGVVMFSVSAHASTYDLLRMSDQLDQLDRLDLQDSLDKAKRCTDARDFPCALDSLQSARKRTHSARDKADLAAAETYLAAEQRQVEEEERALAERERQIQLAEERLKREEAQALQQARAEEEESMSTGEAVALFGSLLAQSLQNQASIRAAEARNARRFQAMNAQVSNDVARQQQRFAQERAKIEAQRAVLRRPPATAAPTTMVESRAVAQSSATLPTTSRNTTISSDTLAQIGARVTNVNLEKLDATGSNNGSASTSARPTPSVRTPTASVAPTPTSAEVQRMTSSQQPVAPPTAQLTHVAAASPSAERPDRSPPKAPPDPRQPDEDGCIDAIGWCSTSPTIEQRGTTTFLRFKNTCPFRVYGTFINGRVDGSKDSGADGVPAGGTHTWTTERGSGRGYIRIVGSVKPSADWVCSGRMNGFTAGDATLRNR